MKKLKTKKEKGTVKAGKVKAKKDTAKLKKRAGATTKAATKRAGATSEKGTVAFNVSLPGPLLKKLDQRVAAQAKDSGTKISRSAFVREQLAGIL